MPFDVSRRVFLAGGLSAIAGCNTLASLEQSATSLDTYDIAPLTGGGGRRRNRTTLLVLEPAVPAALATDRILIRAAPQTVTYLPDGRWVDEVPLMLQSLLIRSASATGQMGFVGTADAGPVPDLVLLTRLDDFGVVVTQDEMGARQFVVQIGMELTMLRDRDQQILGSRQFRVQQPIGDDEAPTIAAGFQRAMDGELAKAVGWIGGFAGTS